MNIDQAIAPGQLMAEIAEIDVLLMHYEDWRALLQLEAREKQGDSVRSISGDTLKALLLESLSVNPLFARRQHLLAELEKMARDLQRLGPRSGSPEPVTAPGEPLKPIQDDLSRISGIDARLAKRLNILNVRSFKQIANWTAADVEYVSNTLGLDNLIVAQDWIGQAARLAPTSEAMAPAIDVWVHARNEHSGAAAQMAAPVAPDLSTSMDVPQPVAAAKVPSAEPADAPPKPIAATAEKPVAASVPASPIVAEPQAAPVAKVEQLTPAPARLPAQPAPVTIPIAASVAVVQSAAVDERWKNLVPASPLAARNYTTESPPLAAPQEPSKAVPAVPEKLPNPAMPLAAGNYKGAVLEPKHDGAVYAGLVPAKPLPAPAYKMAAPVAPVAPIAPAVATPQAPTAAQEVAAQAAFKSPDSKAADILQHTLPPLPLRPSAPPAQPVVTQVQTPAQPPIRSDQPAAAAAQSEALLLAVAAARSPLVSGAAPPPLPLQARNGQATSPVQIDSSHPVSASARSAHVFPAATPPPMRDDTESRSRQATVEARVTIKRAEEALSNTVLRTPGGTEVYLGARRGPQADEFDGTSYAAYRGSTEEASVQIVRRPPAARMPDAPPPLTPAVASAAQAAAKAEEASRPPLSDPVDAGPPAGTTMGRFLKALTGQ